MAELKDNTLTAVLDANVLYPMVLRDTLLWAAIEGCFRAYWSAEILNEVERNLVGDNRISSEGAHRLRRTMETAFPDALVDGYQHLIPAMRNHAKDRHVAAVAAVMGAKIIVTSNIRDFRLLPRGIRAMEPDKFLQQLWNEDANLVRVALQSQSDAYERPKLMPDAIVERLRKIAPGFAKLWQENSESWT
jgi:hypothetical protein